jgi:hypothetical protein
VVNYIVALLVPWVEADYEVENPFFPIYVPVKVSWYECRVLLCMVSSLVQSVRVMLMLFCRSLHYSQMNLKHVVGRCEICLPDQPPVQCIVSRTYNPQAWAPQML